ncbi:DUF523 domain-containing protein [Endozoicomonas lisbonensis]|uniref:Uncharacterized protein YbbK (DUF523 family) n=1 Tax=Endozoicomonas lisbonensis TaxID=3120522 RepID=A0ABV2SJF0_9GAMM
MEKVLISACLLGRPVRYNGKSLTVESKHLNEWQQQGRLVAICPEMEGGLSVPRAAAEIVDGQAGDVVDGTAEVITIEGDNVTSPFMRGAQKVLSLCQMHNIKIAILAEGSPSCGSTEVYDGSFSGRRIAGMGVTSALLERHGVEVFSQFQLASACHYLNRIEAVAGKRS